MPIYEYRCEHGATKEACFAMGAAPDCVVGPHDEGPPSVASCRFGRVFSFRHVEDRRHMRTGRSPVTGMPYAASRSEERALEQAGGFEFVGRSEMPEQWKTLKGYAQHLRTGGERLSNEVINPETFVSTKGDLLKKAVELGVHLGG